MKSKFLEDIEREIRRFIDGGISREEWEALGARDRTFLAGAIAGNYANHHPNECFELLSQIKPKIQ